LVGFDLAMLVSDSSFPKPVATQQRTQLLIIFAMNDQKESSWLVTVGRFFFFIKQIFSVVGAICLAIMIGVLLAYHA
jgi:hypothetical protein